MQKMPNKYFYRIILYREQERDGIKTEDDLILALVGTDGATSTLLTIDGKKVGGKTLKVVQQSPDAPLVTCDMVYISPTTSSNIDSLLSHIGTTPILTISATEDFCKRGGIIQMERTRGKIRLRVNNKRAQASQLSLSSQLLKIVTVTND